MFSLMILGIVCTILIFLNTAQIESLHISSIYITDYSALYKLKNLKSLSLEEPQVPLNLTELESFTNLEELHIKCNKTLKASNLVLT